MPADASYSPERRKKIPQGSLKNQLGTMIATEQWEREAIKTKLLNLGKISQIAQLNTYLITCKNMKKVLGLKPQGPGTPIFLCSFSWLMRNLFLYLPCRRSANDNNKTVRRTLPTLPKNFYPSIYLVNVADSFSPLTFIPLSVFAEPIQASFR